MGTKDETLCFCFGCLSRDYKVTKYNIWSDALKAVFKVETINLCYICKKIAQKSEQFIQDVQRNQIYLENFRSISGSTIDIRHHFQPLVNLSNITLDYIEVTNDNKDLEKPVSVVYSSCRDVEIKLELKQELTLESLEEEFFDDSDFQEPSIKQEECLLEELKEETDQILDNINLKQLKETLKKTKSKKLLTKKERKQKNVISEVKAQAIIMVRITKEQILKERIRMREELKSKDLLYKCEDCIVGFNFKDSYEKHMEMHSKAMGQYKCDICKKRTNTMEKLLSHKKYHQIRYKCGECGLTRVNRRTIKEHYQALHLNQTLQYNCSQCHKSFTRQLSLSKHIAYVHKNDRSSECQYCRKILSSKACLKSHIMQKHPTEMPGHVFKHHICEDCGAGFKNPSQLRNHMVKHSDKKEFYCVECDRSFKSSLALTKHLQMAAPHVKYSELKLQCDQCDKRFGVKRDLVRHLNRVHLNRRPYQCDQCDRAYIDLWSLTDHKRFKHEGEKRVLKHPCPMCDKIFASKTTCRMHMYTHTGERPYACPQCDASFSQPGIRATHVRLVHMRLARNGRPKKNG